MNVLPVNEQAEADEVLRWMWVLSRHVRRCEQAHADPGRCELPGVAWLLLRSLWASPGQTVSGLARAAGLSKSRVSVVADRLEGMALVEKRRDRADQRLVRLYCTGRRPPAWEAGHQVHVQAVADLLAELGADERRSLLAALRKMGGAAERRRQADGERWRPW